MSQSSNTSHYHGWLVLGGYIVLFFATWLAVLVLGVTGTQLLNWLRVTHIVRVFVGDTFIRGGNLVLQLLFTGIATRLVLRRSLWEVGFRSRLNWSIELIYGVLLGSFVMVVLFILNVHAGWLTVDGWAWQVKTPVEWLEALWISILTNTLAAAGEEVMMRGYLLTGLVEAWGEKVALPVMSLLFALLHLPVRGALQTNWILFAVMLALPGALLGWTYLRTKSLWVPIGLHFGWNMASGDLLNLTGKTGSPAVYGAITHQEGPALIIGTEYGIEVGLVGILALIMAAIGVWIWTRQKAYSNA